MAVSKSQLFTSSWQVIFDLISNNVTDPKGRNVKWIFSTFPDTAKWKKEYPGKDFFPIITIEAPDVKSDNLTFGGLKRFIWSITISVFDTAKKRADEIADQIYNTIDTNKDNLLSNGFYLWDMDSSPPNTTIIESQRVHERRLNLKFEGGL